MHTKAIDLREAQPHLAELLSMVSAGTEIILMEGSTPLARIIPMALPTASRVAGLHPGAIRTSEDFDDPLPEEFQTGSTGSV